MSLQYVIDGYNITHHATFNKNNEALRALSPEVSEAEYLSPAHKAGRKYKKGKVPPLALVRLVKTKRLCGKNKAIIVFDGYPPASEVVPCDSEIDVIFSRSHSADEKIKSIVEKARNPKNIVVVSDDNEIRFIVKAIGAKVVSVEEFINPQTKTKEKKELEPEIELTFSQMESINKELRKIWLK